MQSGSNPSLQNGNAINWDAIVAFFQSKLGNKHQQSYDAEISKLNDFIRVIKQMIAADLYADKLEIALTELSVMAAQYNASPQTQNEVLNKYIQKTSETALHGTNEALKTDFQNLCHTKKFIPKAYFIYVFSGIFQTENDEVLYEFMRQFTQPTHYYGDELTIALIDVVKAYNNSYSTETDKQVLRQLTAFLKEDAEQEKLLQPELRFKLFHTHMNQLERKLYGDKPINPALKAALGGVVAALLLALIIGMVVALPPLLLGGIPALTATFSWLFVGAGIKLVPLIPLTILPLAGVFGYGVFNNSLTRREKYDEKKMQGDQPKVLMAAREVEKTIHKLSSP